MEISKKKQDGVLILALKGRLDTLASPAFDKEMSDLLAANEHRLLIDFSQLDFISSSGLRVFIAVARELKALQGRMVLCGLNPHVKEVFDITGFTQLLTIVPAQAEAVKELL
jgi:anti-anti-sigma factor